MQYKRKTGRFDLSRVETSVSAAARWITFCKNAALKAARSQKAPYIGLEYLFIKNDGEASIRCRVGETILSMSLKDGEYRFK